MTNIFISYRREDTSGEAGRLAQDLASRFGHSSVFIDIDAISPGIDFEQRIHQALESSQVTLVMIGERWLGATGAEGTRRIDDEGDYVRMEIAAALRRADVVVVPVLVEGAKMPSAAHLPPEISSLAKLHAFELSNKRWRYDLRQLCGLLQRYDKTWRGFLRRLPRWATQGGLAFAVAGAAAAAFILATGGSAGVRPGGPARAILVPATVPPAVNECSSQLMFAVNGTAGPLKCANGDLNSLAWQYYAKFNFLVMTLGPNATPGQVQQAICGDIRTNPNTTNPKESAAYELSALYYGWRFAFVPDPASFHC